MEKKISGFTLIELMIVLAIAGVLVSMAMPSFQSLLQNNRLSAEFNDLITDLHVSRSEAIKRGAKVSMCASANGTSCSGNASWETGRIIFIDADGDGVVAAATDILKQYGGSSTLTIRASTFTNTNYLQYKPSGFAADGAKGTFTLCDERGASKAKALIVSRVGQPGMATDTNADNIVNDSNNANANVTCP